MSARLVAASVIKHWLRALRPPTAPFTATWSAPPPSTLLRKSHPLQTLYRAKNDVRYTGCLDIFCFINFTYCLLIRFFPSLLDGFVFTGAVGGGGGCGGGDARLCELQAFDCLGLLKPKARLTKVFHANPY